ncbi:hypothetical protein [Pseudomonas sp. C9-3]|uniref:hypothetical protein n=1 Tax=Pseudomonas sp. C9-3 TaxID=3078264 RepID=UPI0028E28195|nr:hypothetical protein [Pseudomonas sp. C9-3]
MKKYDVKWFRERSSKYKNGFILFLSRRFEIIPVASMLCKAVSNSLIVCLPLSSMAHADSSPTDLAWQAQQKLQRGEVTAARETLQQVAITDRNTPAVIFEKALLDDTEGLHEHARIGYDRLQLGPLASSVAVPSAVNLVAVGQFKQAATAFKQLSISQDSYVAGYAQLWELWLLAAQKGGSAYHRELLAEASSGIRPASPQQNAIRQLYAGEGSVDAVFSAIESMHFTDSLQERTARSEAAFFCGGYLQYVLNDYPAAMRLYQRELAEPGASIERPLIKKALISISLATR